MKKLLIAILVMAILALALVPVTMAQEPVTIVMAAGAVGKEMEVLEEQVAMFEEENPDIKVELRELPESSTDRHDLYVTWFTGEDSSVDIYMEDIIWPPEFGAAGWLLPLDDYVAEAGVDMEDFFPGVVRGNTWEGELVSMPWFTDAGLLYYRKDLLEKYGFEPPETFADLKEQALAIMEGEGADMPNGFVWQGNQYEGLTCDYLEYVWGNGGAVLDDEGNVVLDSPEAVEALEVMIDYIESGVSPEGVSTYMEEDARNIFQQGNAVFMRNWPYAWSLTNADDSPVQGKVGAKPMVHGEGKESSACLGGWNLGISVYSEHPDEAFKFIAFLTSAEQQAYKAIGSGQNPTRASVFEVEEVIEANPFWEDFLPVLIGADPRPVHPSYPEISDVIQKEVHAALVGEQDAATATKNAAEQIAEILAEE
jgi:multiple sugar transport system substrate-binding protein